MGLLKRIQEINKSGLHFMEEHPLVTGVYGSIILDRILENEAEPFIYEGKKQGYAEASDEYKEKLLKQADEFLSQEKVFEKERDKYEQLLDAYESEIDGLNAKVDKTESEKTLLYELLVRERELRKLK